MDDWYSTGFSKTEQAANEVNRQRSQVQNKLRRFFIKANDSKEIVFVDDVAFEVWEHNIQLNGKWNNFFTCKFKTNGCLFCKDKASSYVSMFTVVDLTGWTDNKGVVRDKNTLALMAAKADVALELKEQKEERPDRSLVGCQFRVKRKSAKDYSTGSKFTFVKKYNTQSLLAKYRPIDYRNVLAPVSDDQARETLVMMGKGNLIDSKLKESPESPPPSNTKVQPQTSGDGEPVPF